MARARVIAADCDINNDIFLLFNDFQALLDSRVDVDIPNSATVHEDMALKVLRWEDCGD